METLYKNLGNSQTLKDKVYLNLKELIITGKIKPGSRLPEEELSKKMKISRAPIREALNMLEREGFATIIPRKGAIVSEVTLEMVQDVWEMRRVLETYAAKSSIHLIPDSEIERIEKMVHKVSENPKDLALYVKCDLALHEMLYKYKDNQYLTDYISSTASHSLRVRYFVEYYDTFSTEAVAEVCKDHLAIIEALKERNPDKVYTTVENHVLSSQRRCELFLQMSERG